MITLKESKYFHSTACAVTSATLISVSAKFNKSGHVCAGIINITILLIFSGLKIVVKEFTPKVKELS